MGYYWGGDEVNYYRINGCVIGTIGTLDGEKITKSEFDKIAGTADSEMPAPEPTPEERIAALEKDNAELREAMEALLSGVTA